ncbi:MAG TPA: hypothetical protein VE988_16470 [Gemmataceae bacterium]|nr:hypothetical protein [Gemmataceae bacterium]
MSEQPAPAENAEVHYEASDAKIWPIAVMGIGIILLGLVAHSICLWMFDALRASTNRSDPELPALAAKERPKNFSKVPAPQLQVDESKDLNTFRKEEDATLNSYGWVDAKSDQVRIPIEEAMRLLANPDLAKTHGVEVAPAKGGKR